jgi:hypothetical protein
MVLDLGPEPFQPLSKNLRSILAITNHPAPAPIRSGSTTCLTASDHHLISHATYTEIFEIAIENAMNTDVEMYKQFQKADYLTSAWTQNQLSNAPNLGSWKGKYKIAGESDFPNLAPRPHADVAVAIGDLEPLFMSVLFDTSLETNLMKEVKDIRDELGILRKLAEVQKLRFSETKTALEAMDPDGHLHFTAAFMKAMRCVTDEETARDRAIRDIKAMDIRGEFTMAL